MLSARGENRADDAVLYFGLLGWLGVILGGFSREFSPLWVKGKSGDRRKEFDWVLWFRDQNNYCYLLEDGK